MVVVEAIKEFKQRKNVLSAYVFDEYKPQSYSEHFKKILIKNNFPLIRCHDLRHFNATIMLKSGVSDKEAAKRLGHSQVSILREVYQHVLDDIDKQAADKINASLLGAGVK